MDQQSIHELLFVQDGLVYPRAQAFHRRKAEDDKGHLYGKCVDQLIRT